MTAPYLLAADIHFHNWSAFSTTLDNSINSRLAIQMAELYRAARELKKRGGERMYIAGDIFHIRGSIDPEVFNPVHQTFKQILNLGVSISAIPGNHDLAGKDTTKLGNAFQSLDQMQGDGDCHGFWFKSRTEPQTVGVGPNVAMIPWCSKKEALGAALVKVREEITSRLMQPDGFDLIIHAGIDGVLTGVPAHGLTAAEVASWGFKRVFAGDYHNHKVMEGGKVVSIGATTHQTWSDLGSKAGYLFVYDDRVEYQASHAPSFIELTEEDDEDDYPLLVDGNYVRIRGMKLTDVEINKFRKELTDMGAVGVTFQVTRETVAIRTGAPAKSTTLDESVGAFVDKMEDVDIPAVKAQALDVLSTVRSVAA